MRIKGARGLVIIVSAAALALPAAASLPASKVARSDDENALVTAKYVAPLGPISAMTALPPVVDPDAALTHTVQRGAAATGGDAFAALRSLRLLLPNAGTTRTDVYAYVPSETAFCFILWRRQGACSSSADGTPGVRFLVSPGGPGYVGIGPNAPAAVGGVVSDEVKAVDLVQGERTTSVPIANNAFFEELEPSTPSGSTASLAFTYSDGSQRSVQVRAAG